MICLMVWCFLLGSPSVQADPIDYQTRIQPLLTKYCSGCHSADEPEAEFSTESFDSVLQGLKGRPAILPGDAGSSLMVHLLEGTAKPVMPPEDEPAPTKDEITLIRQWIDEGARGPEGMTVDRLALNVPKIPSAEIPQPITALASGPQLAVGRFQEVDLYDWDQLEVRNKQNLNLPKPQHTISGLPGKVHALQFSHSGSRLLIATGVAGRGGWIGVYDAKTGQQQLQFTGHLDTIYAAQFSPDEKLIATSSYDRTIIIWDASTAQVIHTLEGHNGAVYDLAFSPDSKFLITASADDTCKVWRISDGLRLDTLSQPLNECYGCAFSPDGKLMTSVGADKKLRVWKMVSRDKPRINPQLFARFAHEDVVSAHLWLPDQSGILTFGEDGVIKLWNAATMEEWFVWNQQDRDVHSAVAIAEELQGFLVARMDGSIQYFRQPGKTESTTTSQVAHAPEQFLEKPAALPEVTEQEPNQDAAQAQTVQAPVQIKGSITGQHAGRSDHDLYRFEAAAGQQWVIEVNASRSQSPLDSFVEVLDENGNKILRTNLQAVRESYFTFRGKDSNQTGDFRIFNWTEMSLDEYLYANGEVTRLYHYPRGADSGFNVYPAVGNRWGYFDTTPLSHALGEPCYIVRPLDPNEPIIPNGLPVFPIYFENDDCSLRELGSDSRLHFTAPRSGSYLVKIYDVRGYEGPDFNYTLAIRPRVPDFTPSLKTNKLTIHPGSANEFSVGVQRIDGYDGPVTFTLECDVPGITLTSPVTIQAGQIQAEGVISVSKDAAIPDDLPQHIKIQATAEILEQQVQRDVGGFAELKNGGEPKLTLEIVRSDRSPEALPAGDDGLLVIPIHPGETIQLKVLAHRNGTEGGIDFGKEESGRNMPFGVFVDNIGLNGLLITDDQSEREFFVTCDPIVQPQRRLFHLKTNAGGGHASQPVWLEVQPAP
ncbi:MAG: hypothetical protein KDA78_02925 [Planctomycetaceae bacterium]|nr:hypothetical protein [Planctomycetaceae bacterium]